MCGEHLYPVSKHPELQGSSPHVRGALDGNVGPATVRRDHPRMCGEHKRRDALKVVSRGSSPHVRGAQTEVLCLGGDGGIIPACAGSTVPGNRLVGVVGDHPRMCGEQSSSPFRI